MFDGDSVEPNLWLVVSIRQTNAPGGIVTLNGFENKHV